MADNRDTSNDPVVEEQTFLDQAWIALEGEIEEVGRRSADAAADRFAARELRKVFERRLDRLATAGDRLVIGQVELEEPRGDRDSDFHQELTSFHIGEIDFQLNTGQGPVLEWRSNYAQAFYSRMSPDGRSLRGRRTIDVEHRVVRAVDVESFGPRSKAPQVDLGTIVAKSEAEPGGLLDSDADASEPRGTSRQGKVSTPGKIRGEDLLLAELEAERDGFMRKAVATIQADQDRAIRAPRDRAFIVEGGPGTGKTVVGLHRVAKIIYDLRAAGEETSILVVGPNERFMEYVSRVLPSLGENTVTTKDFPSLCLDAFPPNSKLPKSFTEETDPRVASVKGDAAMCGVIRVAAWSKCSSTELLLRVDGRLVTFSKNESTEILQRARDMFVRGRSTYELARQFVVAQLETRAREKVQQAERLMQEAEKEAKRLHDQKKGDDVARRSTASAGDVAAERQGSADETAGSGASSISKPKGPSPQTIGSGRGKVSYAGIARKWLPNIDPTGLVAELLTSATLANQVDDDSTALLLRHFICRPVTAPWTTADLPLFDEAMAILGESARRFRHVVVDEAQDLSPMAWRVVARRTQGRSLTILGDLNQQTALGATPSWADALVALRIDEADVLTLGLSYRLPAPVLDFAKRCLPHTVQRRLPRGLRPGSDPEVVPFASPLTPDDVEDWLVDNYEGEYVGIITVDPAVDVLKGWDEDTVVLQPSEAKGLEFDVAILVEPADWCDESENDYRRLFIALTRPTKRLIVLHHKPLPPRIADE